MGLKGKRILVTGGAGFVGSHLVDLLAPDNEIIVVDDFSTGKEENLDRHKGNDRVRIAEVDVRCSATLKELAKGVDIVYHLAAKNLRESIRNPEIVNEVNVTGTVNVCQAALANLEFAKDLSFRSDGCRSRRSIGWKSSKRIPFLTGTRVTAEL